MADPTPPSGQYGELREQARAKAMDYPHNWASVVDGFEGVMDAVEPIYVAALEAKDREIERRKDALRRGGEELSARWRLKEQAEQREAEARRHLAAVLQVTLGHARCESESCPVVAAKNFLESKPLGSTVEGEE